MRITNIETIMLSYLPSKPPRDSLSGIQTRDVFLVKVDTDEGIIGIGEGFALGSLHSTAIIVEEILKPLLKNEDPTNIDKIWEKMYRGSFRVGRRGIVLAAMSAIDIALWDVLGKKAGLPVYKLLGGASASLSAYASAGYYQEGKGLAELHAEMKSYKEQGFKAVKMKVGGESFEEDIERVRTAREALGSSTKLAVDANNAYDYDNALRFARAIEKEDIFFFEEPLSSDDIRNSRKLADKTDIPIAGYETEYTRYGLRDLLLHDAVDIVQTDAIWTGGISEARKIGILAAAFGKKCIPHFSAGIVSLAANLHFGASLANVEWFELTMDDNPLRSALSVEGFKLEEGTIFLPDKPGLGIELDEEVLKKHQVSK
ncbi:mandelate racemase/muconate lactonizing enzyme family protein [Halalkalibacter oceani]|uniref:mandelate racemase/muconate lactonizing enzyme family protein n=1 Tax=Halalkalibacter oceani TaxID=1653776 RepID=UPI003397B3A7